MGEGNRLPEKRQLTEELIKQIDAVSDSPQVRANFLWEVIQNNSEVTDWDIVCFAAEALGFLSTRYSYLSEATKQLLRLVYSAHYFYPHNFNERVANGKPVHRGEEPSREPDKDGERANAPKSLFERSV